MKKILMTLAMLCLPFSVALADGHGESGEEAPENPCAEGDGTESADGEEEESKEG